MPEMVISNTSPLFYLYRLRHLDLLQKLYQRIIVPEAVVNELQAGRDQGEDIRPGWRTMTGSRCALFECQKSSN